MRRAPALQRRPRWLPPARRLRAVGEWHCLAPAVQMLAINARIAKVLQVYQHDAFAEYSNDVFNVILGSEDESDE